MYKVVVKLDYISMFIYIWLNFLCAGLQTKPDLENIKSIALRKQIASWLWRTKASTYYLPAITLKYIWLFTTFTSDIDGEISQFNKKFKHSRRKAVHWCILYVIMVLSFGDSRLPILFLPKVNSRKRCIVSSKEGSSWTSGWRELRYSAKRVQAELFLTLPPQGGEYLLCEVKFEEYATYIN